MHTELLIVLCRYLTYIILNFQIISITKTQIYLQMNSFQQLINRRTGIAKLVKNLSEKFQFKTQTFFE